MTRKPPQVEERVHPVGEEGVRTSLEEVAKRAAKGATRPDIRAWAIECLDRARKKGIPVKTPKARAQVLLKAVQEKLWVPDPINAEFVAGAHLLACTDKEALCFKGGDCDDLTVLLAAAFMSVGIHTMIVGHAYSVDKRISHVLAAAHVGGRWHYADPSTDYPLGQCVPPTRERLLSVPNIKILCDDTSCFKHGERYDPERNEFVVEGVFVGVDGPPRPRLTWLNGLGQTVAVDTLSAPPYLSAEAGEELTKSERRELTFTEKVALAGLTLSAVATAVQVALYLNQQKRLSKAGVKL